MKMVQKHKSFTSQFNNLQKNVIALWIFIVTVIFNEMHWNIAIIFLNIIS